MKNPLIQLLKDNAKAPHLVRGLRNESTGAYDVYLKGVISADWGASATELREAFAGADGGDVALHINSPGGDVFEGREMQAVIAGHKGAVTAIVEGVAASAATIVSMAADTVQMMKGSRYMIHKGWTIGIGNADDFEQLIALLRGFDTELAAEYAAKSGQTAEQTMAWMAAETWFTAEQAVENGFAESIVSNTRNEQMRAAWNLAAYANAPQIEDEPPAQPDMSAIHAHNRRRMQLLAAGHPIA